MKPHEKYNEIHGTHYTASTWAADNSQRVLDWKEGWWANESTARALLQEIVDQYNAAPDGPLGKGFTNGVFLEARKFL